MALIEKNLKTFTEKPIEITHGNSWQETDSINSEYNKTHEETGPYNRHCQGNFQMKCSAEVSRVSIC